MSYINHGDEMVGYFRKNPSQAKEMLSFFLLESLIPYWVNRAVSKVEGIKNNFSVQSKANLQKGKITNTLVIEFLAEGKKLFDAEYQAYYRNMRDMNKIIKH